MINLQDINFYLLKNNPFYFAMLQETRIKFDATTPHLAFVAIKNKLEMTINPDKMAELTLPEQAGIIMHEFGHIFSGHIKQSVQKRPEAIFAAEGFMCDQMLTNIAMDCEINSRNAELKNSPNLGINSKGPMRGVFCEDFKLNEGESWNHHLKSLMQNAEVNKNSKGNGMGEGEHGDHEYFGESTGNEEFMDHVIANAAKRAKESTRMYQHGNMPYEVEEFLNEYEKNSKLPWNLILRQFMQALVSVKLSSSWKKKNRRFKGKLPGVKKEPRVKLLVGMDESGSVGDEERSKLITELVAMNSTGMAEIWVLQFDTEEHAYFKFTGEIPPRRARGGTDFSVVHEKALANGFKGVIMLTDGECNFPDKNEITYKSLWIMTTDAIAPYGQSIRIK